MLKHFIWDENCRNSLCWLFKTRRGKKKKQEKWRHWSVLTALYSDSCKKRYLSSSHTSACIMKLITRSTVSCLSVIFFSQICAFINIQRSYQSLSTTLSIFLLEWDRHFSALIVDSNKQVEFFCFGLPTAQNYSPKQLNSPTLWFTPFLYTKSLP